MGRQIRRHDWDTLGRITVDRLGDVELFYVALAESFLQRGLLSALTTHCGRGTLTPR